MPCTFHRHFGLFRQISSLSESCGIVVVVVVVFFSSCCESEALNHDPRKLRCVRSFLDNYNVGVLTGNWGFMMIFTYFDSVFVRLCVVVVIKYRGS